MTPQTWADVASWGLLAVGAALALGTGAALLHYRRKGVFPGQPLDDDGKPLTQPSVRTAIAKVALGVALAVWGFAGLTFAPLTG